MGNQKMRRDPRGRCSSSLLGGVLDVGDEVVAVLGCLGQEKDQHRLENSRLMREGRARKGSPVHSRGRSFRPVMPEDPLGARRPGRRAREGYPLTRFVPSSSTKESELTLLETSESHLGSRNVLLGVLEVLREQRGVRSANGKSDPTRARVHNKPRRESGQSR